MEKLSDMIGTPSDAFESAAVVHRRHFLAAGAATMAAWGAGSGAAHAQAPKAKRVLAQSATEQDRAYMKQAIELMRQAGVVDKTGGPFGAVVVRDGVVLAATGNSVLRDNDPSAHAEVNAIRMACKKVGAPNLKGATLFSSCEPCPMCYSTAYWARVGKIYYAAAWTDYADLFDDSNIDRDMKQSYAKRQVPVAQLMQSDAQQVWLDYRKMPEKTRY
ncbi:MAG: Cytidine/deoxycytidylate deaminase:Tat pathway signal [Tardiphaga sp.]|nr:Cytidine/deoxycytidylate deaminase:Tat pathway signal [Tardiphaga sp.]